MAIQVGDTVKWGSKANPHALAFTGCKVLELGQTEDGRPAARLDLGRFGEACAAVDELVREE